MVNIDKEQTQIKFGYSVDSLTKGSHKKVVCSCSFCGNPVEVSYKNVVKKIENNQNIFCDNKCSGEFCRNNPEFKEKVKNANRPNEEARREKIKNAWTDDKRKEHSERIKEILTEDLIKQRAESLRKHYEDESNKARLRMNATKNWENPEYREAIINAQESLWTEEKRREKSKEVEEWHKLESNKEFQKARREAWWNGLTDNEKEEYKNKISESASETWTNLPAERKSEILSNLHSSWKEWNDNLTYEDRMEIWQSISKAHQERWDSLDCITKDNHISKLRDNWSDWYESLNDVEKQKYITESKEKANQTMLGKYGTTSAWAISRKNGTITTEQVIRDWMNSLGFNFKESGIPNNTKQLDGYDKEHNIAFEYCGLYWHNEQSPEPRDKFYHISKLKACNDTNIRLFTIFEDEWLHREAQVKGRLKAALGKCSRRFVARKLKVKLIDTKTAQDFYEAYHIQGGKISDTYSAGLFNGDELIGAMSFGKHHRNNKEFVLNRLCFKEDCYVIGGASRLFKFLLDESKYETIISWSDNRWSEGGVYESLGFIMEENMKPDYSYVDSRTYDKRIPKQSQQKRSTNCPEGKTEKEWAEERGLYRIWDCGKVRWKYESSSQ
jgi:hypothetical protein